jgi:hypothetical protein
MQNAAVRFNLPTNRFAHANHLCMPGRNWAKMLNSASGIGGLSPLGRELHFAIGNPIFC